LSSSQVVSLAHAGTGTDACPHFRSAAEGNKRLERDWVVLSDLRRFGAEVAGDGHGG